MTAQSDAAKFLVGTAILVDAAREAAQLYEKAIAAYQFSGESYRFEAMQACGFARDRLARAVSNIEESIAEGTS